MEKLIRKIGFWTGYHYGVPRAQTDWKKVVIVKSFVDPTMKIIRMKLVYELSDWTDTFSSGIFSYSYAHPDAWSSKTKPAKGLQIKNAAR